MSHDDVWFVLDALDATGVNAVVGGGWGVDALVGTQSREHRDLDLYVEVAALSDCHRVLTEHGFAPAIDWLPTRVQYEDARTRAVDIHPLRHRGDGSAALILLNGDTFSFPPGDLAGCGTIGGRPVTCLTAERQLAAHSGYEHTERDEADIALLVEHLGDG